MTATQPHETTFPIGRDAPFSLPPVYEETLLRDRYTKVRMSDGREAWFFHRHEDVRAIMLNPALSANRSDPGYPAMSSGGKAAFRHFSTFLISMDGEEHRRNRKPLIPIFSMKRMRAFRPRIEAIVDEAIAGLRAAGSPADLVTHVSSVVPRRVIAELMGVTPEHLARFYELAGRFLDRSMSAQDRDETAQLRRRRAAGLPHRADPRRPVPVSGSRGGPSDGGGGSRAARHRAALAAPPQLDPRCPNLARSRFYRRPSVGAPTSA